MTKVEKKELEKLIKRANRGALYYTDSKKVSKKFLYKYTLANWKVYITELILMINEIDTDVYIHETPEGIFCEKIKLGKRFKELSAFEWNGASIEQGGAMFRGKMCTMILFWLLNNAKRVCEIVSQEVEGKPTETKRRVLRNVNIRVGVFITNFLAGDTHYSDSILEIMELMMACDNMKKTNKYMKIFVNQKWGILDALSNEKQDDAIIWDSVIKLSYMLVTNNTNFKNLQFIKKMDVRNPAMIKESVGRLGIAILIQRAGKKRIPPMYRIYELSHPVYFTSIEEVNERRELNYGVAAINFLRFMIDDERFDSFIMSVM